MNMDGHTMLIKDLEELLDLAKEYQFHDFKNGKFAAPKIELVNRLNDLATKVTDGAYDN